MRNLIVLALLCVGVLTACATRSMPESAMPPEEPLSCPALQAKMNKLQGTIRMLDAGFGVVSKLFGTLGWDLGLGTNATSQEIRLRVLQGLEHLRQLHNARCV